MLQSLGWTPTVRLQTKGTNVGYMAVSDELVFTCRGSLHIVAWVLRAWDFSSSDFGILPEKYGQELLYLWQRSLTK